MNSVYQVRLILFWLIVLAAEFKYMLESLGGYVTRAYCSGDVYIVFVNCIPFYSQCVASNNQ